MILSIVYNSKLGQTVTNSTQKLGLWSQILNMILFFVVLLTLVPTLLLATRGTGANTMVLFWIIILIFLSSVLSSISVSTINNGQSAPQIAKTDAALTVIFNVIAVAIFFWMMYSSGRMFVMGVSGYKMILGL